MRRWWGHRSRGQDAAAKADRASGIFHGEDMRGEATIFAFDGCRLHRAGRWSWPARAPRTSTSARRVIGWTLAGAFALRLA